MFHFKFSSSLQKTIQVHKTSHFFRFHFKIMSFFPIQKHFDQNHSDNVTISRKNTFSRHMKAERNFRRLILSTYFFVGVFSDLAAMPILPKKPASIVVVTEGQTLYQIAKTSQLTLRQLYKFNEFNPTADILEPGTKVYLSKKKRKSTQIEFIIVDNSTTLRQIANNEGIRLKSLMRMNQGSSPDEQLPNGEKVFLR